MISQVSSAESLGMKCKAFLTEMNSPIGRKIGNALEIQETVEFLIWKDQGNNTPDLKELVFTLGILINTTAEMKYQLEKLISFSR
jgi:pyrimidine-nucleoside phosphorylase